MAPMTDDPDPGPPHPRANPDLFGHADAESTLKRAFDGGRLPHAWLITGPRGVGKATLAYRFARHVLAGGGAGGQADLLGGGGAGEGLWLDPDHPVFHRVAAGGHADLITISRENDPKSDGTRREILVDEARRLSGFLSLTPAEGGWRVAVIDAADEMNRHAANAVLKLVEEPPARSLMLLVCHSPGLLLPTLKSRCRTLALAPLADSQVAAFLARWRPDLPEADRAGLALLAEGSPGRALELAAIGGLDLYRDMLGLIAGAPGIDPRALHGFGDRLARRGAEPAFATTAALLAGWVARLAAAGGRGTVPAEVVPGEAETARRLLAAGGLDRWVALWEKITDLAARAARVHLDRKQVVLSIFAQLEKAARPDA